METSSKTSTAFEEEIKPEDPIVLQPTIPPYTSEKVSTKDEKPEIAWKQASTETTQKPAKKRRKHSRRKRKKNLSLT